MRPTVFFRLRLRLGLQNTVALPTPVLSLNLVQRLGGESEQPASKRISAILPFSWPVFAAKYSLPITAPPRRFAPSGAVFIFLAPECVMTVA